MANITLGGNPCTTNGTIPQKGDKIKAFTLSAEDLSTKTLSDFAGKKLVLNIFPSVDTGVCATSIRKFNESAAGMADTAVLCISRDLPFAQKRFCGAEGIENVVMLSDFVDGSFGNDYGLTIDGGGFNSLHSRVVIVTDADGVILHSEQVPEIGQEPNYEAALSSLS